VVSESVLETEQTRAFVGRRPPRFVPPDLQTIADTGLPPSLIEQLILKFLYFKGDLMGSDLCRAMGLRFSLIEPLIQSFKTQQLLQVKSSLGYGNVSSVLALTEAGRRVTRDYIDTNQYVGPAPVPVEQYTTAVQAQRFPPNWLSMERLEKAYSHLIVTEDVLNQIGPAVSSGKSLLIYGQPGNGKTQMAEALALVETSNIYVPYALECQGNIVQLFDPVYHTLVEGSDPSDGQKNYDLPSDNRWARCKRPFISSGGELALSMLDLTCNPVSNIYDAPFHLKANNGIYLVDDFGRQKASPAEILNRWIYAMERRVDCLAFLNGGKMNVPFETFLVFSTNLTPDKLGDEAFLRRIQYKMLMASPKESEFITIFRNYCEKQELAVTDKLINDFVERKYGSTGKKFRRCHPRDIISQAIDYIRFRRLPYELTPELLDQAFASCFISTTDLSES
jgi:energy-coupling factor transporter ATP-binding protein EcfA2